MTLDRGSCELKLRSTRSPEGKRNTKRVKPAPVVSGSVVAGGGGEPERNSSASKRRAFVRRSSSFSSPVISASPCGGADATAAAKRRSSASACAWRSAANAAANSSSCSCRNCALSLAKRAWVASLCSARASRASTNAITRASLSTPGECPSTRMASDARGNTMAREGNFPSGASCCSCGPRSSDAAPRQKTAFSSRSGATSSEASTRA
mmetsp:Transcript_93111/g.208021  ORF Transcript_93111/g.208021 Transcript_93111/m.208021 type:complete len:209 (+) Transcript_93111:299-925(+)